MKHILIADDSASVANALAACLHGYYAVTVTHGSCEALERAYALPSCDLLVTDYLMPQMDGAELAERFRAVHPGAKVLLLTGLGDDLELAHDPSDARLTKPFGPLELRAAVASLIGPP
jgi:CheY-like chemotaxis protein